MPFNWYVDSVEEWAHEHPDSVKPDLVTTRCKTKLERKWQKLPPAAPDSSPQQAPSVTAPSQRTFTARAAAAATSKLLPLPPLAAGKTPLTLASEKGNTRLQQLFVKECPAPRE